ncbi:MAG: leucine-rich repeat protein [Lachnospiraceae bacterium]
MKQLRKRSLSWFLVIVCVMSLLTGIPVKAASGDITYLDENGIEQVKTTDEIKELPEEESNELEAGWYFIEADKEVTNRITVQGDVRLILANGKTLTVNGGIEVPEESSLTVYSQTTDKSKMGSLIVQNVADGNAGIGGGGTVSLYGGKITVTGGTGAAAIGGNQGGAGGVVTIGGSAKVTATGGANAAAIGGGVQSTGGTVSCFGNATVSATAGEDAVSGIGAGKDGVLDSITVKDGSVVNSYLPDGTNFDTLAAKEVTGVASDKIIFRCSEVNGELLNDEVENGDAESDDASDGEEVNGFTAAGFKDTAPEGFDASDDKTNPYGKRVITANKKSELVQLGETNTIYGQGGEDITLTEYDATLAAEATYSTTAGGNFDGNMEGKESQFAVVYLSGDNVYLGVRNAQGKTSGCSDYVLGTKQAFYGTTVANEGVYKQYLKVVTGDFDNNDYDEIAVYNPAGGAILVLKLVKFSGNAYSDMNQSWEIAYKIAVDRSATLSMTVADLTQDGYDDLAYAVGETCKIYEGAGSGMFNETPHDISADISKDLGLYDTLENLVLETVDFDKTGQKSLVVAGCEWYGSSIQGIRIKAYNYGTSGDFKRTQNLFLSYDQYIWDSFMVTSPKTNFNFVYLGDNGDASSHYFYLNGNIVNIAGGTVSRVKDLAGEVPTKDNYPALFYKDYHAKTSSLSSRRTRYKYCEYDAQAEITEDGKAILAVTQYYDSDEDVDMLIQDSNYDYDCVEETYDSHWFTNYIEIDLKYAASATLMKEASGNRRDTYAFVNTDNDTTYMKYTGNHYYSYTDPQILAVLASPPYFKDLLNRDDLSGNYAESGTSYGTSKGNAESESNSSTITAGASINYEKEIEALGVKIAKYGATQSFEYNYTRETEESSGIEYSVTYSTSSGEDKVVLYSIPREIYEYRVCGYDANGEYQEYSSNVCIPKSPSVVQLNLDDYNVAVANYQGLPRIDENVLTHTLGEPATYPSGSSGFNNTVTFDGNYSAVGFTGVDGGSSQSQEIVMTEESSNSYSSSYDFLAEIYGGYKCVTIGASFGGGWENGKAIITTEGSSYSAQIQDMPIEAKDYGYYMAWKLFAYESKYNYKGQTLSFPVVSYMVKDVTQPPEVPEDFEQDYANTTDKQIALRWSYDKNSSGFNIYRTYKFNGGTKVLKVGTVQVSDGTLSEDGSYEYQFIDENLNPYTDYQYQIETIGYGTLLNSMLSQEITAITKSSVGYPELSIKGLDEEGKLMIYPDITKEVSVSIDNPDENRSSIMYQWQKEEDGDWTDISGATESEYRFAKASFDTAGTYRCRVDSVYYDSNTGQNLYLTAYTEDFAAEFEMRKATSTAGLKVSHTEGIPEAEITLVSAKTTNHSVPTGTVTFRIVGTNYETSYTSKLRVDGDTSTAKLSGTEVQITTLQPGVYEVTAIYSGSGIFSSYESETAILLVGESGYHAVIYNATTNKQTDTMTYGDGAYYVVEQYQQNDDGTITKETVGDPIDIDDSATNPEGTYNVTDEENGVSFTYYIEKQPIVIGLKGDTTAVSGEIEDCLPQLAVIEGELRNNDSVDTLATMKYINRQTGSEETLTNATLPGFYNVTVEANVSDKYSITCVSGTFEVTTKRYSLTTKVSSNGTVEMTSPDAYSQEELTASPLSIAAGTKLTYKATPKDGYKVNQWVVKTDSETETYQSVNTISFNMPAEAVSVTVYFTPIYYKLTVAETEGGTVTCDSSFTSGNTYPSYTEKTFTAVANEGYRFAYWQKYVGSSYKEISDETITVSMKDGNVTLYPIFEREMYTLDVDERLSASYLYDDDNDRTTDDVVVTVNSGDEIPGGVTVKVAVKEDAEIAENEVWTLNGTKIIPEEGNYEFVITENSEISVVNIQTICEHANTEVKNAKEATCTENGYTGDTYCTDCELLLTRGEDTEALGHAYVNGVCSVCDDIFTTTVNGITYQVVTKEVDGKPVGETVTVPGKDVTQVAVAVTGIDETLSDYISDGKVTIPRELTGSGSDQTFVVTEIADNAFAEQETTEMTGIAEIVVPDTVTKVGDGAFGEVSTVTFYGEEPPAGIAEALCQQAIVNVPDGTAESYRNVLGENVTIVEVHVHTFAEEWTYDATCHWHEATCGHDTEVADKQAHTFSEWIVTKEATEEEKGLKERSCACGYKEVVEIPPLSHTTHVKDGGTRVAPTCEDKGSITYKCTECGEVIEVVELDALGHIWNDGKITKEPTETEEGVKTYTCTVCGKTKTEPVAKKKPDTTEQTPTSEQEITTQDSPKEDAPTTESLKQGEEVTDDKKTGTYVVTDTVKKEVSYQAPVNLKTKAVIIPETIIMDGVVYKVTKIADSAFKGNKTITKVTVGNNITSIGKDAFKGATKLKTVTVGKNVTEIGTNAFNGCKKLKTLTLKSTKLTSKTVAKNAFKGLTKETTIKVPKKKLSAYKSLFKKKGLSSKVNVKGY